jgi:hypothetical protein
VRRYVTASLVTILLIYVGFAGPYALRSIKQRYYPNPTSAPFSISPPHRTDEVRTSLATTPVYTSEPDGVYIFRLDKPRHLYAFSVEYTLRRSDQSTEQEQRRSTVPSTIKGEWWLKVANQSINVDKCGEQVFPGPYASRQTFFINNVVNELKLVAPPPPFRFTIHSLERIEPAEMP